MKHFNSRLLISAAAVLPRVYGQVLLNQGTDQVCIDPLHTIVYEYPAYFSSVFETAGTINNFFGGTNSLIINNPPQTVITSTILTTTIITTATTTATVTKIPDGTPVTLGAGLPSGTVTSVPSDQPIALAYVVDAISAQRPKGFVSDSGTDSDPSAATDFYLQDGQLRTAAGAVVGRNFADTYASMVPTMDPEEVTGNFSFVDGILHWDTADQGAAVFYECPDGLYAGFPDAPFSNCTVATIGGITVDALAASQASATTTSQGSDPGSSMSTSMSAVDGSTTQDPMSTMTSSDSSGDMDSSTSDDGGSGSTTMMSSTMSGTTDSSTMSDSTTTSDYGSSSDPTMTATATTDTDMMSSDPSSTMSSTDTASSPTATTDICTEGTYDDMTLSCGQGSTGLSNIATTQENSFSDCVDTCFINTDCMSVDFKISGGFCYQHDSKPTLPLVPNADFNQAQYTDDDSGNGDDSSTTSTSATDSSTTTMDASTTDDAMTTTSTDISVTTTTSDTEAGSTTVSSSDSSTSTTSTSSTTASTGSSTTSASTTTTTATSMTTTTASTTTASTTTASTTTTTTTGVSAATPVGVTVAAPSGPGSCTANQCPSASVPHTYSAYGGIYYAVWQSTGLTAQDFDPSLSPVKVSTFDLCVMSCNAKVDTVNGNAPCISVSYNPSNLECYYHRSCRYTATSADGTNGNTDFMSAEKEPLSCTS